MKNNFEEPMVEVVRFDDHDIILTSCTGNCGCNVAGVQFDKNETCSGANNPTCTCAVDTEVNCA